MAGIERASAQGRNFRDIIQAANTNRPTTVTRAAAPTTASAGTTTAQPRTPATTQLFRPDAEQYTDVKSKALPHHPDTPAGRELYARQITDWENKHGTAGPNKTKPYPLTPGTTAVTSSKCWKCGKPGHRGLECEQLIPGAEQKWRSIASTIQRRAEASQPLSVNIVSEQDMAYQEDQEAMFISRIMERIALEQGKGQGSSTTN
ncbi:hypothetical protein BD779DRAFT_1681927 [Infundibulicybe gibba]|nr:hypothetical protein BD779DRAFT_1681927 [Infundibulicybe gibba]